MQLFRGNVLTAMSRRKTLEEARNQSEDPDDDLIRGDSDESGSKTSKTQLRRTLTSVDLVLYGVGSSVGAGIYVLVGLGAKIAGPAISLSFLGCGMACILTALSYAEFASRIPVAGSAFTYVYVAFGEFLAWIVGWFLILGYGFTASVVGRAWADYTGDFFMKLCDHSSWIHSVLQNLTEWPMLGDETDYSCSPLSIVIIAVCTYVCLRGAKDSSRFNNFMTVMNISVLLLVIAAGVFSGSVRIDNLQPFVPETKNYTSVLQGAGLVFFAFIGFDMVASLSEEVIKPERNMPIGIVGSLIISTLIYVSVAISVVGMAPIYLLGETVPVINALVANAYCTHEQQYQPYAKEHCIQHTQHLQQEWVDQEHYNVFLVAVSHIVAFGAIFGLMGGTFTSLMGQPRIFYRMAQDGLFFPLFAKVDATTRVPSAGIIVTGIGCSVLACFVPLDALANLISLGTLMVFTVVNAGVILLRLREVLPSPPPPSPPSSSSLTSSSSSSSTAGASSITTITIDEETSRKDVQKKKQCTAVYLLLLFMVSLLILSITFSHTTPSLTTIIIGTVCGILAILSFIWITLLPPAWSLPSSLPTVFVASGTAHHAAETATRATPEKDTAITARTTAFQCPYAPYVPMGGIACNTFMMGSLPLSSWFFCLVWLMAGIAFYFAYGIKHSVLGKKMNDKQQKHCAPWTNNDATPLLNRKSCNYSAATSTDSEQEDSVKDDEKYEMHQGIHYSPVV